jgi:septum formation protein
VILVLASASPRRQELLREAGIHFVAHAAKMEEKFLPGEPPRLAAERLAREKAEEIAKLHRDEYVLGADTVVAVNGEPMGKPADQAEAVGMLRRLAGCTHEVITGVCLISPGPPSSPNSATTGLVRPEARCDVRSEVTVVTFAPMEYHEIEEYVATGEPMDKAGAYAIQGVAAQWIPRIEGDYNNVVGLPVALVKQMLREHDLL